MASPAEVLTKAGHSIASPAVALAVAGHSIVIQWSSNCHNNDIGGGNYGFFLIFKWKLSAKRR